MNSLSRFVLAGSLGLLSGGALAAPAHADYRVLHRHVLGGDQGWDYLAVDAAARRLYVSHGDAVEVLDADSGKRVGRLDHLDGVLFPDRMSSAARCMAGTVRFWSTVRSKR